jgi:serine protease AprX
MSEGQGLLEAALARFWEIQRGESRGHELKRQFEALVGGLGPGFPRERLRELLILLLYYGTWLDVREIAGLRRSHFEPAEMGRFKVLIPSGGMPRLVVLSPEVSAVVRHVLGGMPPGDDFLFPDAAGRPLPESEVFALARRQASSALGGGALDGESAFQEGHVVLPIPARMRAHPGYAGRGVVVAFIDSGFVAHPDLVRPRSRIVHYEDLTGSGRPLDRPHPDAWHGTMTAVACAGGGYLSNGLYRGIAHQAGVVLLAIGREGRILPEDIQKALEWVLQNRARLGIRIVNVSLGGEGPPSYRESAIDEAAELLVQSGVLVVAAAGNDPLRPSMPPANAPSVLTVGGLVDKSLPHEFAFSPYRSQYGRTADQIHKPELVAPGALVAAPILPGTPEFKQARGLFLLRSLPDEDLVEELRRHPDLAPPGAWQQLGPAELRERVEQEVVARKLVGPHYQHVDGTSFAAPIVASVAAQILEARPALTPQAVRDLLVGTAAPIPHIPRERQGYGRVRAFEAVEAALAPVLPALASAFEVPEVRGNRVFFRFPAAEVAQVSVAGSFNQWAATAAPLSRQPDGTWAGEVEVKVPGRHAYKFVLDGRYWVEDKENPRSEPDGYGGLNSVVEMAEFALPALDDRVFPALHDEPAEADRGLALSALDFALALPNAAWNSAVRRYYLKCLEHVLQRLAEPAPVGSLQVVQLYNCGVVLRAGGVAVGIDVVTGRHVWGVHWRVPEELVAGLASHLDALLVTQRLPDHLDLDIVQALLANGRPVGAPEEVRSLIAPECLGFGPGREHGLTLDGQPVRVRAHRAAHWGDETGRVVQRSYEVELGGFRVHHLADHDHSRFLEGDGGPDVVLATVARFGPRASPAEALDRLVLGLRPGLLVPTHLAELGQPGYGEEGGYDAVSARLLEAKVPSRVLTWGEALLLPRS